MLQHKITSWPWDSKVDCIFQTHVLRFTGSLFYYSFKAQEDGKRHHFAIQKDDTSKQETLQHEKNLLEIRVSQLSTSKR